MANSILDSVKPSTKLKSYPASPKRTASLKTWEAYNHKVAEIAKYNAKITAAKKEREQKIKRIQDATAAAKKKAGGSTRRHVTGI